MTRCQNCQRMIPVAGEKLVSRSRIRPAGILIVTVSIDAGNSLRLSRTTVSNYYHIVDIVARQTVRLGISSLLVSYRFQFFWSGRLQIAQYVSFPIAKPIVLSLVAASYYQILPTVTAHYRLCRNTDLTCFLLTKYCDGVQVELIIFASLRTMCASCTF